MLLRKLLSENNRMPDSNWLKYERHYLIYRISRGKTNFEGGWFHDLKTSRMFFLSLQCHPRWVHPQKERSSVILSLSWENLPQSLPVPTSPYPLVLEVSYIPVPPTGINGWNWCWGVIHNVYYSGTGKKVAKMRTRETSLDREGNRGRRVLRGRE